MKAGEGVAIGRLAKSIKYMARIFRARRNAIKTPGAGIGSDIFKEVETIDEYKKVNISENLRNEIHLFLSYYFEETKRESLKLIPVDRDTSLLDSKFFGIPYIPNGQRPPKSRTGEDLVFLSQINCKDLPKTSCGLPSFGLLQFWVQNNNDTEIGQGEFASKGHRVVYFPEVDEELREEDVLKAYQLKENYKGDCFNFSASSGIDFRLEYESMPYLNNDFEGAFNRIFEDFGPSQDLRKLDKYEDIIKANFKKYFFAGGNKLLGYPDYPQHNYPYQLATGYDLMLLQLTNTKDLANNNLREDSLMQFYITKEDLNNLNFENTALMRYSI